MVKITHSCPRRPGRLCSRSRRTRSQRAVGGGEDQRALQQKVWAPSTSQTLQSARYAQPTGSEEPNSTPLCTGSPGDTRRQWWHGGRQRPCESLAAVLPGNPDRVPSTTSDEEMCWTSSGSPCPEHTHAHRWVTTESNSNCQFFDRLTRLEIEVLQAQIIPQRHKIRWDWRSKLEKIWYFG